MASLSLFSARVQVLPWQRQSLSFSTEGLGDALEGDFSEACMERQTWRELGQREKEKETFTHVCNYLFKPPSRHIDLHRHCNMNLDSVCMEMKCLKGKSEFANVAPMV